MSTTLTAEQNDLRAAVTDLLSKRSPETEVRRLMADDTGYDPAVWAELAGMGLLGLTIPERFGGSGAGAAELAVVAEQMGRALLCSPYLSTAVLTPSLLLALDDDAECADALPRIAAGELVTAVAYAEPGSARPPQHPDTTAARTGDAGAGVARFEQAIGSYDADVSITVPTGEGSVVVTVTGENPTVLPDS